MESKVDRMMTNPKIINYIKDLIQFLIYDLSTFDPCLHQKCIPNFFCLVLEQKWGCKCIPSFFFLKSLNVTKNYGNKLEAKLDCLLMNHKLINYIKEVYRSNLKIPEFILLYLHSIDVSLLQGFSPNVI